MINSQEILKSEYLKEAIFDLFSLIRRANNSMIRPKNFETPNNLTITGFERIRQQCIDELNQLLLEFGLNIDNTEFVMTA